MHQDDKIGSRSLEMLKIRANLEAKLREKGLYNCGAKSKLKNSLSTKPTDGYIQTEFHVFYFFYLIFFLIFSCWCLSRSYVIRDDFDDEVQNDKSSSKSKLSHMVLNKGKKVKVCEDYK